MKKLDARRMDGCHLGVKASQVNGKASHPISDPAATSFRHVGIGVSDMRRSLPFYRDLLGLQVWADFLDDSPYLQAVTAVRSAGVHMVKLKTKDGVSVELIQYLSHPRPVPPLRPSFSVGCSHAAFQVDNLDALYAMLKAKGVPFHTPPVISPDKTAKVTHCRDPEGVIIELVEVIP